MSTLKLPPGNRAVAEMVLAARRPRPPAPNPGRPPTPTNGPGGPLTASAPAPVQPPRPRASLKPSVTPAATQQPQMRLRVSDLMARWPQVFDAPVRPLAVGVGKQMKAAGEVGVVVKAALTAWMRRPEYLQALAAGGPRFGLDGAAAGAVADKHRRYAQRQLDRAGLTVDEGADCDAP